VEYATDVYGVDGIYFDQLGTGMCYCFNPAHKHGSQFDAWYRGYQELLTRVSDTYFEKHGKPLSLMGEMVCDQYGSVVDRQLAELFVKYHTGGYPEVYRYTFPEHGIVDMAYPEKNMAMRPVHVGQKCRAIMARHFTCGCALWIYDLVDDNSFTRDKRSETLLREVIALRQIWLDRFGLGTFLDEQDISYAREEDVLIKHFVTEDGTHILPCFDGQAGQDRAVRVDIPFACATAILPSGEEISLNASESNLMLPAAHASLIVLK
jgi:hypothetical protein